MYVLFIKVFIWLFACALSGTLLFLCINRWSACKQLDKFRFVLIILSYCFVSPFALALALAVIFICFWLVALFVPWLWTC